MGTLKEESKRDHSSTIGNTFDALNCGSLQRLADASEKMAHSYSSLIEERNLFERYYKEERERNRRLRLSNAALRGAITKLKAKAR